MPRTTFDYKYGVKGIPSTPAKSVMTPFASTITSPVLGLFFGNPICVRSSSLQYGKSHYSLFIQRSMRAGVTIGLPDTLPCCCPTAATAPPPPAPLFPPSPLTLAWSRATTNPLPRSLAAGRLGPGAESAGALLSSRRPPLT